MTIFRLLHCFSSFENEIFTVLAVFLSTLNGFFNSILFYVNPQVLKEYQKRKTSELENQLSSNNSNINNNFRSQESMSIGSVRNSS